MKSWGFSLCLSQYSAACKKFVGEQQLEPTENLKCSLAVILNKISKNYTEVQY
jgi:hypothetical protein